MLHALTSFSRIDAPHIPSQTSIHSPLHHFPRGMRRRFQTGDFNFNFNFNFNYNYNYNYNYNCERCRPS